MPRATIERAVAKALDDERERIRGRLLLLFSQSYAHALAGQLGCGLPADPPEKGT